jgi:hypothetical protein
MSEVRWIQQGAVKSDWWLVDAKDKIVGSVTKFQDGSWFAGTEGKFCSEAGAKAAVELSAAKDQ